MNELSLFTHVTEGVTNNDYYTPKWIFDAMGLEFDIDVCAPAQGIPWIPAKRWFSQLDDGLSQDWYGLVWMNPPYSNVTPWVRKFMAHGNGMALVPIARSKWLMEMWNLPNAVMMPTYTDLKFETPDGNAKTISYQTLLIAMGDLATQSLRNMQMGRVR